MLVIEKKLGYIDVKSTSGVYFFVQAFGNQSVSGNGILRFEKERLNIGGGMNLKSGIFTAPKTGIYYAFLFAIVKSAFNVDYVSVFFRLNGIRIGDSAGGPGIFAVPVSFPVTLKLKRGDRIDLQKGKK